MNTRVPAASRRLYGAAGTLIGMSILICLIVDLKLDWLAVVVFLATLIGALLGGFGALIQDRAQMDAYGRNYPEPDPHRQYVFHSHES